MDECIQYCTFSITDVLPKVKVLCAGTRQLEDRLFTKQRQLYLLIIIAQIQAIVRLHYSDTIDPRSQALHEGQKDYNQ